MVGPARAERSGGLNDTPKIVAMAAGGSTGFGTAAKLDLTLFREPGNQETRENGQSDIFEPPRNAGLEKLRPRNVAKSQLGISL